MCKADRRPNGDDAFKHYNERIADMDAFGDAVGMIVWLNIKEAVVEITATEPTTMDNVN